ncbi:hypothetical protein [Undibacterium sp. Di24W]|uniref:hypothetical protein n=1 Tax=Undibacterium sp. Di24W TaxID=3413033 RepID=UPI003BF01B11
MSEILLTYQSHWQPETKTQRAFAFAAAVTISQCFFAQFNQQSIHASIDQKSRLGATRELILTWIKSPTKQNDKTRANEVPKKSPAENTITKTAKPVTSLKTNSTAKQRTTDIESSDSTPTSITVKDVTGSDPLFNNSPQEATLGISKDRSSISGMPGKPNSAAIRAAYEASKSDIQKMADASNKTLINTPASKYEQFQGAANRAAKPDCLRQGGSILSLFVVAYQAATDHCK